MQATGARLGTVLQAFSSIGIGLAIGFVYSWKLSLMILAFAPFIVFFSYLEMKFMMIGNGAKDKEALETAGKVITFTLITLRGILFVF